MPSNCGSHLTMYRVGELTPAIGIGRFHEKLREAVVLTINIKFCGGPGPIEMKLQRLTFLCRANFKTKCMVFDFGPIQKGKVGIFSDSFSTYLPNLPL